MVFKVVIGVMSVLIVILSAAVLVLLLHQRRPALQQNRQDPGLEHYYMTSTNATTSPPDEAADVYALGPPPPPPSNRDTPGLDLGQYLPVNTRSLSRESLHQSALYEALGPTLTSRESLQRGNATYTALLNGETE